MSTEARGAVRPPLTPEEELFRTLLKQYRMYQGEKIKDALGGLPSSAGYIVEGLIGPASVNILVGDSGVGKSPLAYQLALAVASGTPFLGLKTRKARVMVVDYENALADSYFFLDQQRKHLGLANLPGLLVVWPLHLDPFQKRVERVLQMMAADLVIIDSLRSLNSHMESDTAATVEQIKRFRVICSDSRGAAFLLIHHLHKRAFGKMDLEQTDALDWMRHAAGVRALINQTDSRIALAKRAEPARKEEGGAELVLRGHFRARGEIGPFLLRRAWDEAGEPLGFERFKPELALLEDPEQEQVFRQLPRSFMFRDVRKAYGKHDETTNRLIHKLLRLGFVRKIDYGHYQKVGLNGSGRLVDVNVVESVR